MHERTILIIEDLNRQYCKDRESDWDKLSALVAIRGLSGSSVIARLDIGFGYIEKLINRLFEEEKLALFHEKITLQDDYFDELIEKANDYVMNDLNTIRSKVLVHAKRLGSGVEKIVLENIEKFRHKMRDSINTKAQILKYDLQLGILPSNKTNINIHGDVGVINSGQVYGDIQVKIEKFKESNLEVAKALSDILEVIEKSNIKDEDKVEQMQNVDFLTSQCELPTEKRNRGMIKAAERFISTSANLITIWQTAGPLIMKTLDYIKNT